MVPPAVFRTRFTRHPVCKAESLLPFVQSGPVGCKFFAPLQSHERIGPRAREQSGHIFTQSYLAYLETVGIRVINDTRAFALEISKARQLQLLNSLGLRFPKTHVVNCANEILAAALQIGFPLLVKPNIGGRGAGIVRLNSMEQLEAAIDKRQLELWD